MNFCRSMCTAAVALSLAAVGCGKTEDGAELGTEGRKVNDVRMEIRLPDGTMLNTLTSTITGGPSNINRPRVISFANSATILYREGGLPVGNGYHVALEGSSTAGQSCVGQADFNVPTNAVTTVMLTLFCGDQTDDVDGVGDAIFSVAVEQNDGCPVLTAITGIPLEVFVGSSLQLTAQSTSATANYAWSGPGGTFSTAGAASTGFQCDVPTDAYPGNGHVLTVTLTDGECTDTDTVTVYCTGVTPMTCGNGAPEGIEQCDDGNTTTEACAYGQQSCTVCSATCTNVPGDTSYCGDGQTDTANGEECDGGATCDANCDLIIAPPMTCGNGMQEGTEQCDDGNMAVEECAYGQMSCTVCGAGCLNVPGVPNFCGDGNVDAANGEQCDGVSATCDASCHTIVAGPTCNDCRNVQCTAFTEDALNVYGGCFMAINTDFGANAADPTFLQECMNTVQCAFDNNCAYDPARGPNACYCGSRSASDCAVMGPAADAKCPGSWVTATRASSNAEVVARFSSLAYPSGWANALLQCDALLCNNSPLGDCTP